MDISGESAPDNGLDPVIDSDALRQTTEDAISLPISDIERTLSKRQINADISEQLPMGAAAVAFIGEVAIAYPENPTALNFIGTIVGATCTAAVVRHLGYKLVDKYWSKRNTSLKERKKELKAIPETIFGDTPKTPQ